MRTVHGSNMLLRISQKYKPILLKIIPIELLRKVKRVAIHRSMQELSKSPILQYDRNAYEPGINFIGPIRAESGLGQSCRLIVNQIALSNISYAVTDFDIEGKVRAEDKEYEHV